MVPRHPEAAVQAHHHRILLPKRRQPASDTQRRRHNQRNERGIRQGARSIKQLRSFILPDTTNMSNCIRRRGDPAPRLFLQRGAAMRHTAHLRTWYSTEQGQHLVRTPQAAPRPQPWRTTTGAAVISRSTIVTYFCRKKSTPLAFQHSTFILGPWTAKQAHRTMAVARWCIIITILWVRGGRRQ